MTTENNIQSSIKQCKSLVDGFISEFLLNQKPKCKVLFDAMQYSVDKRGKRLRSFMILKSAEYFKISQNVALVVCLCIEMIHAYSLIHDDMPCMDNSPKRDGLDTNHIKYGEANALLAGNSLLTLVFEILSSPLLTLDDKHKLEIIHALSKSFGYNGVMGGQAIDVMVAGKQITDINIDKIFEMQQLKTGEFFAFCSSFGAIINGSHGEYKLQKQFGYLFGKLYQVVDDIMDEGEDSANSVLNFISKNDAILLAQSLASDAKNATKIVDFKNLVDYVLNFVK